MLLFLTLIYVAILFGLIKLGTLPNSKNTWMTLIPFELVLVIGFFIPMQWGAPGGTVTAMTYSVSITPNVSGEVVEVPVKANVPLKAGDVLFKIDPVQFQAALDTLRAQLNLAKIRLEQAAELAKTQMGSVYDVQTYEAEVDGLNAQIANAEYNLEQTIVRAPTDGIVTNLALRPGTRVANIALYKAMAFIDTSEVGFVAQIHQIYTRNIEPGQTAELTFKSQPGKIYTAKVLYLIPATAQGQAVVSGSAVSAVNPAPGPFAVRLELDDPDLEAELVPGSAGTVAIYTDTIKPTHIIRKVMIRMTAITNYFNPA
jgi:RND family efflux transporter MFP subunit